MTQIGIAAGILDVEQRGSSEPVVFIHPFMTNHRHWRHVVPLLEGDVRCPVGRLLPEAEELVKRIRPITSRNRTRTRW